MHLLQVSQQMGLQIPPIIRTGSAQVCSQMLIATQQLRTLDDILGKVKLCRVMHDWEAKFLVSTSVLVCEQSLLQNREAEVFCGLLSTSPVSEDKLLRHGLIFIGLEMASTFLYY